MPIVLAGFSGSSPLARGKHLAAPDPSRVCRLIPARAGKTAVTAGRTSVPAAHPRSRGENTELRTPRASSSGSSPLARGKHRDRPARHDRARLIPARAGKTAWTCARSVSFRAHPRSRGENQVACVYCHLAYGSSPLARGKRRQSEQVRHRERLIPARAGKTCSTGRVCGGARAHPRSRGENANKPSRTTLEGGSSPLARGKLLRNQDRGGLGGLIPARAGKTSCKQGYSARIWAHPRSRGENTGEIENAVKEAGSSPLARGKHWPRGRAPRRGRLIPARAGKTTGPSIARH